METKVEKQSTKKLIAELCGEVEMLNEEATSISTKIKEFEDSFNKNNYRFPFVYEMKNGIKIQWREHKKCLKRKKPFRLYIEDAKRNITTDFLQLKLADRLLYVPFFDQFVKKYTQYLSSKRLELENARSKDVTTGTATVLDKEAELERRILKGE